MDVTLKNMLLEAVDSTYIFALHNVFTGYTGSLTKYIMNNLMTRYGQMTASDIKEKKKPLQEPLESSHPIDVFFKFIYCGVQCASEAITPFLP